LTIRQGWQERSNSLQRALLLVPEKIPCSTRETRHASLTVNSPGRLGQERHPFLRPPNPPADGRLGTFLDLGNLSCFIPWACRRNACWSACEGFSLASLAPAAGFAGLLGLFWGVVDTGWAPGNEGSVS